MSDLVTTMLAGKPLDGLIVDAHGHLGPSPAFHIPDNSPAATVARMDRVGVARLCIASHTACYADFRAGNDETAEAIAAFSDRFIGGIVLNAHYPDEVASELDRCLARGGFRYIKLHSSLHKYRLDAEVCEPIWREAERRGLPVLVHSWAGSPDCGYEACNKVAMAHPDVRLVLGHSLAPDGYDDACRLAEAHPNVWLDTVTSLVNYGQLDWMVGRIGPERILYGSDMPFLDPAPQLAKVVFARIAEGAKRRILGENAARLLGLAQPGGR
ncbi:MAG: amidohydrolase [Planctomycetes bacterium]|nr:amidohydrolase [Planctomycetota bacterium]